MGFLLHKPYIQLIIGEDPSTLSTGNVLWFGLCWILLIFWSPLIRWMVGPVHENMITGPWLNNWWGKWGAQKERWGNHLGSMRFQEWWWRWWWWWCLWWRSCFDMMRWRHSFLCDDEKFIERMTNTCVNFNSVPLKPLRIPKPGRTHSQTHGTGGPCCCSKKTYTSWQHVCQYPSVKFFRVYCKIPKKDHGWLQMFSSLCTGFHVGWLRLHGLESNQKDSAQPQANSMHTTWHNDQTVTSLLVEPLLEVQWLIYLSGLPRMLHLLIFRPMIMIARSIGLICLMFPINIEHSYSQYLVGRNPGGIHSINPFVRSSVSSLHRFGSTSATPRYPASVQLQQLVHTRVVQNWTLVQDDVGKSGCLASKIARFWHTKPWWLSWKSHG